MYCFASAAIHCGAPSGYSSHGCDARQRERASVRESVHPWTASVKTFKPRQICGKNEKSELSLLRQDAAQTGPRKARRRRVGKCPQGTAQDARSFAAVHGRTVSEPPERLRAPAGQEPGGRAFRGVLSLVTLFAQAKRVTRSAAGRVEALRLQSAKRQLIRTTSSVR